MSKLLFWYDWPKSQKFLFQLFLILFGTAITYYFVGYFWSSRFVIHWETISNITTLPLVLETWKFASIPIDITVNQYLISQVFEGSDLLISYWPAMVLLLVLAACLILGLSLATDLSRFWFLASQIVFIFTLVGFKLEQLLLFNRTDKAALIFAFLLYLPTSYYFHAVRKQAALLSRLMVFSILTVVFGVVIYNYSGVSHPFLYLVGYGMPIPMALTVIFILFTGHEVIYGFLVLITRSNSPKSSNSFFHFLALSTIYLVNVLILYLRNTRRIEWDFYYLDAFWILMVVSAIGVWSLRRRGELFKYILPVEPHGILGFVALATISFTTIGYFFATANDPAIEALEDAIVFSQLCIGFVFLVYILFNFKGVLIANLKVYKVVYKPQKMPFFSMRLGGFIGVLALFLISGQYPLDQAVTAYYNGIGDLHRIDDKPLLAKEYYKLAAVYARTNHRSNYAIASMAKEDHNPDEALAFFKLSLIKQPTPFAYVNTAGSYESQSSIFQAMFVLKDGLEEFPGNAHISNNLAALYGKIDLLDSAFYFLDNQSNQTEIVKATQTNQLALLTRSQLELPFDSIFQNTSHDFHEVGSNLILMANSQNLQLTEDLKSPSDSLLNPITFSWWYNYNLNQRNLPDSNAIFFLKQVSAISENQLYSDNLEFARIIRLYYSGDVQAAFMSLRILQYRDTKKSGYYNDLLGQWSLQHQQSRLALDYFERSIREGYLPAFWHMSLALTSMGQYDEAAKNWSNYIYQTEDSPDIDITDMLNFCIQDGLDWESMSDQEKFWLLQFKSDRYSWIEQRTILERIQDSFIYQEGEQWWWNSMLSAAKVSALSTLRDAVGADSQESYLRHLQLAVVTKNYNGIEELLAQFTPQDLQDHQWLTYARALISEQEGDLEQAEIYYINLVKDPFFEQGILDASRFISTTKGDEYGAYELLLDALTVNEYSVKLLKAYGEQCARLNLDTYGQTTLDKLEGLVSAAEFQAYRARLEEIANNLSQAFEESEP